MRFENQRGLSSFSGGLSSQKKTRSTSASGSLLKFLTRRQVEGPEIGSTSNFVIWYVASSGTLTSLV